MSMNREQIARMAAEVRSLGEGMAEVPGLPRRTAIMRVQCENHSKPHNVRTFVKIEGRGWAVDSVATAESIRASRRDDVASDVILEHPVTVDDETASVVARGATPPVSAVVSGQRMHRTHDLTCPRCKRARRHASVTPRDDDLQEMFDQLQALKVSSVTPEFLARMINERTNSGK